MKQVNYHEALNWLRCRYKWYLSKRYEPLVSKPELSQGTDIHEALAYFYGFPPEERTNELLLELFNAVIDRKEFQASGDSKELSRILQWESKGRELLDEYWVQFGQDSDIYDAHIEEEHVVHMPDGWVDASVMFHPDLFTVREVDGRKIITILDHKTGKEPDIENLLLFDTQKLVYATMLYQEYATSPEDEVHVAYNVLGLLPVKVERLSFQISHHQMLVTLEWLNFVLKGVIEEENCYRTPSFTCHWDCDFYPVCRAGLSDGDEFQVLKDLYREKESK